MEQRTGVNQMSGGEMGTNGEKNNTKTKPKQLLVTIAHSCVIQAHSVAAFTVLILNTNRSSDNFNFINNKMTDLQHTAIIT